jgi:hypothetical protein
MLHKGGGQLDRRRGTLSNVTRRRLSPDYNLKDRLEQRLLHCSRAQAMPMPAYPSAPVQEA